MLSAERPRGRLFSVGSDWLYRREYRPMEADMAELAALTVADLTDCLARYPLTRSTTLVIGPSADCPEPGIGIM